MSENINQVFMANPITVNAATDLMYFGQSPYGAGNDAAMTFANFNAQIVANGTANQIGYYATTGNKISGITGANNGILITNNTGIPSLLANSGTPGFVLTANSGAPPSWQGVSASGAVTVINGDSGSATPLAGTVTVSGGTTGLTTSGASHTLSLTGTLILANGGTSAALTASNGGIIYSTASAMAVLAGTATANQMLQSGSSTTPAWSTTTWPATSTINQILYSSSANTIAGLATANNGVLITSGGGVPSISSTLPTAVQSNITQLGTQSSFTTIHIAATGASTNGIVMDNTNDGTFAIQAGVGSGALGGGYTMFGSNHGTFPGWTKACISAQTGSKFAVNSSGWNAGGTDIFTVDRAGVVVASSSIQATTLITAPAASQTSALSLGSAYQNTFGYDVVLTVYVAVTSATAGSILCGVGPTNTPTQQTVVSGITVAALSVIPITVYLPKNYYALISNSGTITDSISGQQAMPV